MEYSTASEKDEKYYYDDLHDCCFFFLPFYLPDTTCQNAWLHVYLILLIIYSEYSLKVIFGNLPWKMRDKFFINMFSVSFFLQLVFCVCIYPRKKKLNDYVKLNIKPLSVVITYCIMFVVCFFDWNRILKSLCQKCKHYNVHL